jgi:hypothetical protein
MSFQGGPDGGVKATYLEVSTAFSAYSIWKILPSGDKEEHS